MTMNATTPLPYQPGQFIAINPRWGKPFIQHGATVQRVIDSIQSL
jgi:hypothetical protein